MRKFTTAIIFVSILYISLFAKADRPKFLTNCPDIAGEWQCGPAGWIFSQKTLSNGDTEYTFGVNEFAQKFIGRFGIPMTQKSGSKVLCDVTGVTIYSADEASAQQLTINRIATDKIDLVNVMIGVRVFPNQIIHDPCVRSKQP